MSKNWLGALVVTLMLGFVGAKADWDVLQYEPPVIYTQSEIIEDSAIFIGCETDENGLYYVLNILGLGNAVYKPSVSTRPDHWEHRVNRYALGTGGTWMLIFEALPNQPNGIKTMMDAISQEPHLSLILLPADGKGASKQREFGMGNASKSINWLIGKCRTSSGSSRSGGGGGQYGDTPLHAAIRAGDDARARQLIATTSKRDQCRTNDLGHTAGDLADIFGNIHIRVLLPYDC